eukprot:CAMPEP_0181295338 /NCGR_PEP_ID=MMETSP1101-20121128/4093_1 /TAXON_ID=46948 /ORGANISM="Rhodomonas abbreviata, Strain Caron Lab Isolate" /LENGTH=609 /DNA_ID=CAMNT_0023400081 /DNA_START=113 /DNA_END=1942 /DNA_ORIENTATION=-
MKGGLECCNCMLQCGWTEYDEQACRSCMRLAKRKLPQNSARRQETKKVGEVLSNLPSVVRHQQNRFDRLPQIPIDKATTIVVFEFDGVLFKTPQRPAWWPFNGYHQMMNSLLPPTVPDHPEADWWDAATVEAAKRACASEHVWAVLITYRHDAFKGRISALLAQQGIEFDEIRFRPLQPFLSRLGATDSGEAGYGPLKSNFTSFQGPQDPVHRHSLVILGDMIQRAKQPINEVVIHAKTDADPQHDTALGFEGILRSNDAREIKIRFVETTPHPAGKPSEAELQAMILVNEYVKKFNPKGKLVRPKPKASAPRPRRSGIKPRATVRRGPAPGMGKGKKYGTFRFPADYYMEANSKIRVYPMLLDDLAEGDEDIWEEDEDEDEEEHAGGEEAGEGEAGVVIDDGDFRSDEEDDLAPPVMTRESSAELQDRLTFEWVEDPAIAALAAGFMEREWSGDLAGDVISVASDDDVISVSSRDDVMSVSSHMTHDDVISISSNFTEDLADREREMAKMSVAQAPGIVDAADPSLSTAPAPAAPGGAWGGAKNLAAVMKPPEKSVAGQAAGAPPKPAAGSKNTGGVQKASASEEEEGDELDPERRGLKGAKFALRGK